MYTLSFGPLMMEQSLMREAPLISQLSMTTVFVISFVLVIFTLLPMEPRSGVVRWMSSLMSRRMQSLMALSWKCFTMKAANWLFRLEKRMALPSPASFSTLIRLPCP